MDDQERNREALIEHIAEQDRIIRRRNEQIAQQAENAREAQNAIEDIEAELEGYRAMHSRQIKTIARRNDRIAEVEARKDELARELAAAVTRAEQAEGDLARYRAMHSEQIRTIVRLQENPRALAADDFGQMEAAWKAADNDMAPNDGDTLIIWKGLDWWEIGVAVPGRPLDKRLARVLHRPPARPEGAEKVEAVLHQYWSGDINGDDLADRIVEEMNR